MVSAAFSNRIPQDHKGCDLHVVLKKMYDYIVSVLGKEVCNSEMHRAFTRAL